MIYHGFRRLMAQLLTGLLCLMFLTGGGCATYVLKTVYNAVKEHSSDQPERKRKPKKPKKPKKPRKSKNLPAATEPAPASEEPKPPEVPT